MSYIEWTNKPVVNTKWIKWAIAMNYILSESSIITHTINEHVCMILGYHFTKLTTN